jgi:hypothetical protein
MHKLVPRGPSGGLGKDGSWNYPGSAPGTTTQRRGLGPPRTGTSPGPARAGRGARVPARSGSAPWAGDCHGARGRGGPAAGRSRGGGSAPRTCGRSPRSGREPRSGGRSAVLAGSARPSKGSRWRMARSARSLGESERAGPGPSDPSEAPGPAASCSASDRRERANGPEARELGVGARVGWATAWSGSNQRALSRGSARREDSIDVAAGRWIGTVEHLDLDPRGGRRSEKGGVCLRGQGQESREGRQDGEADMARGRTSHRHYRLPHAGVEPRISPPERDNLPVHENEIDAIRVDARGDHVWGRCSGAELAEDCGHQHDRDDELEFQI